MSQGDIKEKQLCIYIYIHTYK